MKAHSRQVAGAVWFGALLIPVDCLWAGSYQVGVAPSTVKVIIAGASQGWPFEGSIADHYDLYLARGEHEAMQVVVMASDALTNARVAVSVPQETHGAGPLNGEAKAWVVGHVNFGGWFPDPLLTFTNTCNINAGDRVAFWIDVSTLREATAGDYVATITVTADNSPTTTLQLNIHVWDFELPLKASLPTAFSLNETLTGDPGGAKTLYGSDWESKGIEQKFWDMQLDHRMGMSHLYSPAAESFDALIYWAARGDSALCLKKVNKSSTTDPDLVALVPQVSAAGLLGMSYVYGFDEVGSDMFGKMYDAFSAIHSYYPGLRTMTTARDPTFGTSTDTSFLRPVVDIWVPLTPTYDLAAANQLRAEGKDMWWYTCISPDHPYANFFVEYAAIEPRLLMGLMAYKYQSGGFLYYNIANWPLARQHGPITSGPYTNWDPVTVNNRAGDGSLCCAGPDGPIPTIRMENIRDGLEDYEYLKLLGDLVTTLQAGGSPTAQELAWISSAQQLLAVPSSLVGSLEAYTRDAAVLENYREQLAAAILTGKMLSLGLLPPGDHDYDGDVDQSDFGYFQLCLTGSRVFLTDPACWWADMNNDGFVDWRDVARFRQCMSGAGIPADTHCAE